MKTENLSHTWNVAAVRMAVLLSVLLLSFVAKADFTKGKFVYRVLENGDEVEVCGWTSKYDYITIPEEVTYGTKTYTVTRIAENTFKDAGVWGADIPNTITEIGAYAFSGCKMNYVTIPPSVKVIGEYAFEEMNHHHPHEGRHVKVQISDLTAWCDIDFANEYANPLSTGYEYLGEMGDFGELYLNGEHILDLVIPDGVTTIKQYAFCKKFRSVTLPPSVKEIGRGALFRHDSIHMDIEALYLSDLAAWCKVTGDIPRVKNHYLNGELLTDLVIPEGVTAISPNVFSWSESITSVTIPNTVTEIGAHAFYACINLKTALIPNSVKEIKKGAFRHCSNLEKVIIGNSLRTLGDNAFDACDQLKDFYIGNRVPPTAEENVFSYDVTHGDSATLHVPKNSIPDYRMSSVWSQFPHIVEYDASGIEDVTAEEEFGFSVSGAVLTVNGVDDAMIEIYDMSGLLVYEGMSPVVSGLPRGIYLLKAGNRTAKIHI